MIRNLLRESLVSVYNTLKINEVDWDGKFSDTKASCVTPETLAKEMNDELARLSVKSGDREKRRLDRPIYTRGNIEKSMTDGALDVEKFKQLITAKPKTIFDQNPKMEKTDNGGAQYTVNTGIPAISGIIYDNDNDKFYKINTCPGAGECMLVCYARKGFYGLNDGKSLKLIQRLNLLMNDPLEYFNMIMDELEPLALLTKRQSRKEGHPIQLVIRWNDAGDFFSDTYFDIARKVTTELIDSGYNVKSYAYTKQGKYMDLTSSDFIMNFSRGANKREMDKVDIENVKQSIIVPREIFKDIFVTSGSSYEKTPDGLPKFKDNKKEELRQRLAKEYNIDINTLKYLNELPPKQGDKLSLNAIVYPTGDSDIAAQREDVKITLLLIH